MVEVLIVGVPGSRTIQRVIATLNHTWHGSKESLVVHKAHDPRVP